MDFDSLKSTVSNLTLYDIKAGVRKVQNAVMNYTEMEAKVREATNNEPWGASSSLMQEIANGTFNYQQLNEIMPMIYKRFTEKAAEEWRQIYKALQLLEFLIKNGSERVIDDARSHLSLLKMLRQFHFIDQNGKDQGVNVRNRSKELVELLSDVEKIRAERKKARANRNKYGGYEGGGMGMSSSGMGGSSRYGGFGSDTAGYGGYSGGVFGDGGGFGGNEAEYGHTQSRREKFEEYNEYDEGEVAPPGRRKADEPSSPRIKRETKKPEPAKPKQPEVDLFSFDEPEPAPSTSNGKAPVMSGFGALQSSAAADDDDFDDFQSAAPAAPEAPATTTSSFSIPPPAMSSTTTSATQFAQPKPVSAAQGQNLNDIFNTVSPPPRTNTTSSIASIPNYTPSTTTASIPSAALKSPPVPQNYQPAQPNYYTSVSAQASLPSGSSKPTSTFANLGKPVSTPIGGGTKKPAGGADPFASLLGGMGSSKQTSAGAKMADMAKQKSSAGLWGAPSGSSGASTPAPQSQQKVGGGLDELLG